jgi:hypothetical protein
VVAAVGTTGLDDPQAFFASVRESGVLGDTLKPDQVKGLEAVLLQELPPSYNPPGMRCKDYFQVRKFFECPLLSSDPEQRGDELRLPLCIASR